MSTVSDVTPHAVVITRCGKGHRRTIHPKEVPEGQYPTCDQCYLPLLPLRAEPCDCDWPAT